MSGKEGLISRDEAQANSRVCMFIGGASSANYGLIGLKRALEVEYGGAGNVRVFNSVLSTDRSQPRRFRQQAAFIVNSIKDGRNVDVVVHSLGGNEFAKAVREIEKHEPGFFDDPEKASKLRVRPIGVGGLADSFIEGVRYGLRTIRLREHVDMPPLSKNRTLLRGLDSLVAFPLEGVEGLAEEIRIIMNPGESNIRDGVTVVPFIPQRANANYLDKYLSPEQRSQFVECDNQLRGILSTADIDHDLVRELVIKRGELVRPALKQIYEAPLEERRIGEPTGPSSKLPPHVGNLEGLFVFLSLFGGKTLKTLRYLKEKGIEIAPISPEFDVIQPIDTILKLFEPEKRSEITVVKRRGHQDVVLQPEDAAEVFRKLII